MHDARRVLTTLDESRLKAIATRLQDTPYRFDSALQKLRVIRKLAEALVQEDPLELSVNITNSIQGQAQQLESFVQQMESFAPTTPDATTAHSNIENNIESQREWWVSQIRPILPPTGDVTSRGAEIEIARASATEGAAEIQNLLTQVRGAAGVAAARSLSGYYTKSAEAFSERAGRFLLAAFIATLLLAALAIYAFLLNPPPVHSGDQSTEAFIRSLVIRLLFLGIAGSAVAFATRNYRVSKHRQVVNEAKANALNTYGMFARSAPTPDAATIITAELVRSVFGLPDNGLPRHRR